MRADANMTYRGDPQDKPSVKVSNGGPPRRKFNEPAVAGQVRLPRGRRKGGASEILRIFLRRLSLMLENLYGCPQRGKFGG